MVQGLDQVPGLSLVLLGQISTADWEVLSKLKIESVLRVEIKDGSLDISQPSDVETYRKGKY